jgi:hypothetical protein
MDEQNEKYPHTHSGNRRRARFYLVALFLLIAAVFVGGCSDIYTLRDYLYDRAFVPVADITGIPAGVDAGVPLPLSWVVIPENATKKTVAWSVSDPGETGAAITGGVFTAAAKGTAKITARITDGLWRKKDFSKSFTITVIGEYAVTYHLNGGTLPEDVPETYLIEELPFTLPVPDYGENIFLGWYDNARLTGSPVTEIPKGSIGPREYWARWHGFIDVAMTEQASESFWSYDSGTKVITLQDGATVTLTGSTMENCVAVESGAAATVILQDVTINISGTGGCAFDIEDGATVTLLLSGTNALTSGGAAAGIHVTAGRSLVIDSAESTGAGTALSSHAETGSLTVRGGSTGGAGAGIGGGIAEPGGEITIAGGTITAYASSQGSTWQGGAAIGGGGEWDAVGDKNGANHAGTILISGGVVDAVGVGYSAGIGGGTRANSAPGSVTITGGTVTATGGSRAAGIGGSNRSSNGGNITISGGTVTATGGLYGAGIGGGYLGASGNITISGGTVTATGSQYGAGIGGGDYGSGETIIINDGTVDATGGQGGAGIGGGYSGTGGAISINGGTLDATGGPGSAGIGGGYSGTGGNITISGGAVTATGWDNGAGIGGGVGGGGGTISINSPTGTSHGTAAALAHGGYALGASVGPGYNGSGGSFSGPNGETSWPGVYSYSW